jgi:hypothetical protein
MGNLPFARKIKTMEYIQEIESLTIIFNDNTKHTYQSIPPRVYKNFDRAANKNDFYADNIQGQYIYAELKDS